MLEVAVGGNQVGARLHCVGRNPDVIGRNWPPLRPQRRHYPRVPVRSHRTHGNEGHIGTVEEGPKFRQVPLEMSPCRKPYSCSPTTTAENSTSSAPCISSRSLEPEFRMTGGTVCVDGERLMARPEPGFSALGSFQPESQPASLNVQTCRHTREQRCCATKLWRPCDVARSGLYCLPAHQQLAHGALDCPALIRPAQPRSQ